MALRRAGRPDGADHRLLRHPESGLQLRDAPQRHAEADGESNTIRVASYQELVNALIYLIGRGTESGSHPL